MLTVGDAFVGYQDDTPAGVVFQAYHHLKATAQREVEETMSEEQKDQVSYKIHAKQGLCNPLVTFPVYLFDLIIQLVTSYMKLF